jgi:hypothetical protein
MKEDFEESGMIFLKVLFQKLPGGPRKNTKIISQNIRCTDRSLRGSPIEQNSETSTLESWVEMGCKNLAERLQLGAL